MRCSSGLCTGPLLFNIQIKDVPGSTANSSSVTLYADDTRILMSNNCYEEMNRNFNKVLHNSLKWFQANQSKIVKSNPANFSYSALHITFTDHLPVETNAGLQLNSHLSRTPHINYFITYAEFSLFYTQKIISYLIFKLRMLFMLPIFTIWSTTE